MIYYMKQGVNRIEQLQAELKWNTEIRSGLRRLGRMIESGETIPHVKYREVTEAKAGIAAILNLMVRCQIATEHELIDLEQTELAKQLTFPIGDGHEGSKNKPG